MHSEAYPLITDVVSLWRKTDGLSNLAVSRKSTNFLYIGHCENTYRSFSSTFASGIFATNFSHALQLIGDNTRLIAPEMIIIDVELNKLELRHFSICLSERNISSRTALIYNEKKLDDAGIKFLRANDLVDDVIDIQTVGLDYNEKVLFIKKVKRRQIGLTVSRDLVQETYNSLGGAEGMLKRTIDIVLSSVAILLLSPLFLLISLAIRIGSSGPIIYTSKRAGRGFKIFDFYKFRTMEVDADKKIDEYAHLNQYGTDENGQAKFLKINNDPRVTTLGKLLRKTSLDELPQLFNVLKGDMSLVGNRPLPLYEAATLTTNEFVERFSAHAGITGLWQIKKRGKHEMSAQERIHLDIAYARKANVAYDLWIMAKTPGSLFQKSNV